MTRAGGAEGTMARLAHALVRHPVVAYRAHRVERPGTLSWRLLLLVPASTALLRLAPGEPSAVSSAALAFLLGPAVLLVPWLLASTLAWLLGRRFLAGHGSWRDVAQAQLVSFVPAIATTLACVPLAWLAGLLLGGEAAKLVQALALLASAVASQVLLVRLLAEAHGLSLGQATILTVSTWLSVILLSLGLVQAVSFDLHVVAWIVVALVIVAAAIGMVGVVAGWRNA